MGSFEEIKLIHKSEENNVCLSYAVRENELYEFPVSPTSNLQTMSTTWAAGEMKTPPTNLQHLKNERKLQKSLSN